MIRQKDLRSTYWAFYIWSLIGFLPIDFSRKTGKARVLTTGWRRFTWNLWLLNSLGLMLFKHGRLVQGMTFGGVPFEHLSFTIMKGCTGILDNYWHLSIFYWNAKENDLIFHTLKIQDEGLKERTTAFRKSCFLLRFLLHLSPNHVRPGV